jgi:hypothetical protein
MSLPLEQLVTLSDAELAPLDVAATNLACAAGLPGAPTPEQEKTCYERLDWFARSAEPYTRRRMREFRSSPHLYDRSEKIFRVVCLIHMLQGQFRLRYNRAKIPQDVPLDTADTFIHGALLGAGGTCASLPVVYAAVGRRLGYPLKLVCTTRHLFVRWDEPGGERFNIEANGTGVNSHSDDYYRTGMYALAPWHERDFRFLRSQTPRMEVANFLLQRGHRWLELGREKEAVRSFVGSCVLDPGNRAYEDCADVVVDRWNAKLDGLTPPRFPELRMVYPPRRWPGMPEWLERKVIRAEKRDECLLDPANEEWWWRDLREAKGQRPPHVPTSMTVTVER